MSEAVVIACYVIAGVLVVLEIARAVAEERQAARERAVRRDP